MEKEYYVYVYLDPRKPGLYTYGDLEFHFQPFYVGKGTGSRWKWHLRGCVGDNSHKENKIRAIQKFGLEIPIKIIYRSFSSSEAYEEEARIIALIGRSCTGGVLTNYHAGGVGGTEPTEEIKRKISATLTGRVVPEDQLKKMRDYWRGRPGTMRGRKGPSHPTYGRTGGLASMFGRCGELSPVFGRKRPEAELERMRYNKITKVSTILDMVGGHTYKVYNINGFCDKNKLTDSAALYRTASTTGQYCGLQIVGSEDLPERWFDDPALVEDYFKTTEILIPGVADRDTKHLHKRNMKIAFTKFSYHVSQGETLYEVYAMAEFCKLHKLDKASLHKTATGEYKQHKGFTITHKEALPDGWSSVLENREKYFTLLDSYQQAA